MLLAFSSGCSTDPESGRQGEIPGHIPEYPGAKPMEQADMLFVPGRNISVSAYRVTDSVRDVYEFYAVELANMGYELEKDLEPGTRFRIEASAGDKEGFMVLAERVRGNTQIFICFTPE